MDAAAGDDAVLDEVCGRFELGIFYSNWFISLLLLALTKKYSILRDWMEQKRWAGRLRGYVWQLTEAFRLQF